MAQLAADDAYYDNGPAPADVSSTRRLARAWSGMAPFLPHAAMQFPFRHPAVACVLAGVRFRRPGAVRGPLATTDLSADIVSALADLRETAADQLVRASVLRTYISSLANSPLTAAKVPVMPHGRRPQKSTTLRVHGGLGRSPLTSSSPSGGSDRD